MTNILTVWPYPVIAAALAGPSQRRDVIDHGQRVGDLAWKIAIHLGLPARESNLLRTSAVVHDIGKLRLPHALLESTATLSAEDRAVLEMHPQLGAAILASGHSDMLRLAREIALWHHESWDGTGYPLGVARERIPLSARIVAVADVFDALTQSRCYKAAWSSSVAVRKILSLSGRQFDPTIVSAFARITEIAPLSVAEAACSDAGVRDNGQQLN